MDEDGVLDSSDIGSVIDILVCKKLEDKARMQLISKVCKCRYIDLIFKNLEKFIELLLQDISGLIQELN